MEENKKSIVFLYCPLFEFHSYTKFGFFVHYLKQSSEYKDKTLLAAVPEEAVGCVPSADILLAFCHPHKLEHYLNLIDDQNDFVREDCFSFLHQAKEKLEKDFIIEEEIIFNEFSIKINSSEIQKAFKAIQLLCSYEIYFTLMRDYLRQGYWLKPFQEDYLSIKKEMEERKIFVPNKKNYILITRNFIKKQPGSNTQNVVPNLNHFLEATVKNEINIVNIGFPPSHYDITSEYYKELDESFSQSELMSMFYLSDGVLISALAGGFIPISITLNNLYPLTEEWSVKYLGDGGPRVDKKEKWSVEAWRNETGKAKTVNLFEFFKGNSFKAVISLLQNINKPTLSTEEKFAKKQDILYFKQKEN